MEKVRIRGTAYQFTKDFQQSEVIRRNFNTMTETHFGFSLEDWYQKGYWGDPYVPYTLLHDDQIVSNVSVNKLEFDIANETLLGIQIGTVMTREKYRHRGLCKYLLQRVIDEWKDQSDFIYLFANNTVLDLYPKFGFEQLQEHQYSKSVISESNIPLRPLHLERKEDAELLTKTIHASVPISKLAARNHASMILFYGLYFMKQSFFHAPDLDAIIVVDEEGDTMQLHDVFSRQPIDLNRLIRQLSGNHIKKVVLGFTPWDTSGFVRGPIHGPDTLFMLKDQAAFFKENYWMFPALSHASINILNSIL